MTTQPTSPTPIPHPPAAPAPQSTATSRRLADGPQPDRAAAVAAAPPALKEIATPPPLSALRHDVPLSKRMGEPPRPWNVLVGLVLFYLAAAAVTAACA